MTGVLREKQYGVFRSDVDLKSHAAMCENRKPRRGKGWLPCLLAAVIPNAGKFEKPNGLEDGQGEFELMGV